MTEDKSFFEKNLELWERFVSTNMDFMIKSMEKAMEGSKALQEQIGKAVEKAVEESRYAQEQIGQAVDKTLEGSQQLQEEMAKVVSEAVSAQFDMTQTALKSLERQLQTLSDKVDQIIEKQKKKA